MNRGAHKLCYDNTPRNAWAGIRKWSEVTYLQRQQEQRQQQQQQSKIWSMSVNFNLSKNIALIGNDLSRFFDCAGSVQNENGDDIAILRIVSMNSFIALNIDREQIFPILKPCDVVFLLFY